MTSVTLCVILDLGAVLFTNPEAKTETKTKLKGKYYDRIKSRNFENVKTSRL